MADGTDKQLTWRRGGADPFAPCPRCVTQDRPAQDCAFVGGVFSPRYYRCGTVDALAAAQVTASAAHDGDPVVSWYGRKGEVVAQWTPTLTRLLKLVGLLGFPATLAEVEAVLAVD